MHEPFAGIFPAFCRDIVAYPCGKVRQVLWQGTAKLVRRYGMPCWTVRYPLSARTVIFVWEYGIRCWNVRYPRTGNQVRSKCRLCRAFWLDWLVRAPEGIRKKRAFVGRYGNLLLESTVFLCRGVRYLKAALFGAVLVGEYGITPASASKHSFLLHVSAAILVGGC
jgi:hypothetical protein